MKHISSIWHSFDSAPDTALVSLNDAANIASRSLPSLYRDNKNGKLPFRKIGSSTRITVADLRRYIAGRII